MSEARIRSLLHSGAVTGDLPKERQPKPEKGLMGWLDEIF